MAKEEPAEISEVNPVGGVAFFSSLLFLCFLAVLNTATFSQIVDWAALPRLGAFSLAALGGFLGSRIFLPERFCVFVHELKHSIISNLVGNRAKKMKFSDQSGSFTYQYTKKTAAYNALIALAPYWIPLFTAVGLPLALFAFGISSIAAILAAGILFGSDFSLNMRDFSPHQSDITGIRGGYLIGALYIVAMNLTLSTIILAWVAKDLAGLSALVQSLWNFLTRCVEALRTGSGA